MPRAARPDPASSGRSISRSVAQSISRSVDQSLSRLHQRPSEARGAPAEGVPPPILEHQAYQLDSLLPVGPYLLKMLPETPVQHPCPACYVRPSDQGGQASAEVSRAAAGGTGEGPASPYSLRSARSRSARHVSARHACARRQKLSMHGPARPGPVSAQSSGPQAAARPRDVLPGDHRGAAFRVTTVCPTRLPTVRQCVMQATGGCVTAAAPRGMGSPVRRMKLLTMSVPDSTAMANASGTATPAPAWPRACRPVSRNAARTNGGSGGFASSSAHASSASRRAAASRHSYSAAPLPADLSQYHMAGPRQQFNPWMNLRNEVSPPATRTLVPHARTRLVQQQQSRSSLYSTG